METAACLSADRSLAGREHGEVLKCESSKVGRRVVESGRWNVECRMWFVVQASAYGMRDAGYGTVYKPLDEYIRRYAVD